MIGFEATNSAERQELDFKGRPRTALNNFQYRSLPNIAHLLGLITESSGLAIRILFKCESGLRTALSSDAFLSTPDSFSYEC